MRPIEAMVAAVTLPRREQGEAASFAARALAAEPTRVGPVYRRD
ncbi:hypothetical protein [Azohydromonas sediminis]|nr:hypothetical protein [Azohydromonas sediminis]